MNNDEHNSKAKKPAPKKVFDVMRPGKAPASATSRPVIVGHKPQVPDDQFVPGSHSSRWAGDDPLGKHTLMDSKKKVGVIPAHASEDPHEDVPQEVPTRDTVEAASAPEIEPEQASEVNEKPVDVPEENETAPPLENAPVFDSNEPTVEEERPSIESVAMDQTVENPVEDTAPVEQVSNDQLPVASADASAKDTKPLTHDDVLADTSAPSLDQIVVSHHKHHTKLWEWLLILLLIIVVGLVALNFLLDAEVISTNLNVPHTNLVK